MLLSVFLPLSLAFIMFSLGIGLTIADFTRVAQIPKPFLIGLIAQVAMLPLIAFALLHVFELSPELAFGVMILSFCPGGVTSNIITKLAGGALALSISLTAIVSLLSVITVPLLIAWSSNYFLGAAAPEVNVTSLALSMFAITAVPVALGVMIRHFLPDFADRSERWIGHIATVLFVIIVAGALASNWTVFVENVAILGPLLVLISGLLFIIGFALARALQLSKPETVAISIEAGIQNSTVGITVGSLVAAQATALPTISLPSGVYGILMYAVAVPIVLWMRRLQ